MARGKGQRLFDGTMKENIAGTMQTVYSMHERVGTPSSSHCTVVFARPLVSETCRRGLNRIASHFGPTLPVV